MKGKRYIEVMTNLYKGGWRIIDSEENWRRFYKYDMQSDFTKILELFVIDGIITGVFKTSY